jgi:glycosyltransferase involved in cell wall biosynthesis
LFFVDVRDALGTVLLAPELLNLILGQAQQGNQMWRNRFIYHTITIDLMASVSVVIPTYYRDDLLANTLDSVVNQSYSPLEAIVVDDSGEAYANDIVSDYPVNYIPLSEHKGANPARTIGVERSNGEYIQLLDDDDQLEPAKIERQIQRFNNVADTVGVLYCGLTNGCGRDFYPQSDLKGNVLEQALSFKTWPCVNSTMLIKRPTIEEILPLTKRPAADDTGMIIELAQRTEFDYVDEVLVKKNMRGTSRGRSMAAVREHLNIMKEYESLYEQVDSSVRKQSKSHIHEQRAKVRLSEQMWSLATVASFGRVVWHNPSPRSAGYFISSFFGKPGINVWERLFHKIMSIT